MPLTADFYSRLRLPCHGRGALFPTFTQAQVDALNTMAAVFDAFKGHDHCEDDLAYIMATCYRECGPSLNLAIKEYGHGARRPYGAAAGPYGLVYYGRGPTQCTWFNNYNIAKLATGVDFVRYPDLMCDPVKGTTYMVEAMYAGRFTKHCLRNYITPGIVTSFAAFVQARHIINGTDHAEEVAYAALAFQAALHVGYSSPVSIQSKPSQQSKPRLSVWAGIWHMLGGK